MNDFVEFEWTDLESIVFWFVFVPIMFDFIDYDLFGEVLLMVVVVGGLTISIASFHL